MKKVMIAVWLCVHSAWCFSAESKVSGHIFRVSYEPTGIFVSLMNNGNVVSSSLQGCESRDIFFLPSDFPNYSVLSATLYSYFLNNQPVEFKIESCRYDAASIIAVSKVMDLQ